MAIEIVIFLIYFRSKKLVKPEDTDQLTTIILYQETQNQDLSIFYIFTQVLSPQRWRRIVKLLQWQLLIVKCQPQYQLFFHPLVPLLVNLIFNFQCIKVVKRKLKQINLKTSKKRIIMNYFDSKDCCRLMLYYCILKTAVFAFFNQYHNVIISYAWKQKYYIFRCTRFCDTD